MLKDHLQNVRRGDLFVIVPTLAAAAGLVVIGAVVSMRQDVWLLNGLPVPVTIEIDGSPRRVEPEGRTTISVQKGLHHVRVLPAAGGDPIEEGPVDIPSRGFVAYNPLGAAPVFEAIVRYSAYSNNDQPTIEPLGGTRVIARANADFVFEDPPQSIRVKGGQSTSRTVIMQAKGGHRSTLGYLLDRAQAPRAAEIARAIALAAPADAHARGDALRLVEHVRGRDAAIGLIRELLARRPDDFELHRELIYDLRRAGRLDEARAEYRARYEKDRGSADAAILHARFLPQNEARALLDEVIKAHPESTRALLTAGAFAYLSGDWLAAEGYFSRAGNDPLYPHYLRDHVWALVGLKRTRDALALAARFAADAGEVQFYAAMLYAQVARLPDSQAAASPLSHVERLSAKEGSEGLLAFAGSLSGEITADPGKQAKSRDEDLATATKIQLAAGDDPAEAWTRCASASGGALERLHGTFAVLLAAEFAPAGDRALAERMLAGRSDIAIPHGIILDFAVDGAAHPELWRLDPEARAALALVRARALEAAGQSGDALYAEAERGDLLRSVVTRARKSWKPLAEPRRDAKKTKKP